MNIEEIEKLKARAYDIIAYMQSAQKELESVNQRIAELSAVKEEKSDKEGKKVEKIKN